MLLTTVKTKKLDDLEPDDILKRKSNNELLSLKEILVHDLVDNREVLLGTIKNYYFPLCGCVTEKVMGKFFERNDNGFVVYN